MSLDLAALAAAAMAERAGQAMLLVLPQGADVADRLRASIGAERLFTHPATPPDIPGPTPCICLGATDRDIVAPATGAWPAGDPPARHRLRRIDTEYAGSDIGLLLLAPPADPLAILRGASSLLSAHPPIVLLDARGAAAEIAEADIEAAATLLPAHRLVRLPGPVACFVPNAVRFDPQAAARAEPVATRRIPCDDALPAIGLHATEPGAPHGGRWTGAAMRTRLLLPRPPAGRWRLWFGVADWGNAPEGFDAGIDGHRRPVAARDATGFGIAPLKIADAGLVLPVDLYPPLGPRDPIRWPRRIGTRLQSIRLDPA